MKKLSYSKYVSNPLQLNVFTVCSGVYKEFIPLFILSHLYHNDDCFVEVGVDSEITPELSKSLRVIDRFYLNKYSVYVTDFGPINIDGKNYKSIPNTVRFYTTPKNKSEYVYISDVDIICLQKEISKIHIDDMLKTGLPYSNIVRPTKNESNHHRRLSGLHFTEYDSYYPIPNYNELCKQGLLNHDEVFLYELVKIKYPNFLYDNTYRPVHGIHVSPNRNPTGDMNWGLPNWKNEWKKFRMSEQFKMLEPTLNNIIKDKIQIIDEYYG
jgi:hypothetical protein